ncbi:MAG TPA: hypothetical protein VHY37_01580 [Tepidisphaeraceae bacterium]|jgi:hypothetical protein|nr:hypothetical protein [Tepidisphaeraceae bacterium]
MSKRAILATTCVFLSAAWLFVWQHPTSGQTAPPPAARAEANPRGFPLGASCSVYLRGDAAGLSVHDRVMDLSSLPVLKGTLEAGGDHWIVLKSADGKREWIPVDAVAAVVAEK